MDNGFSKVPVHDDRLSVPGTKGLWALSPEHSLRPGSCSWAVDIARWPVLAALVLLALLVARRRRRTP